MNNVENMFTDCFNNFLNIQHNTYKTKKYTIYKFFNIQNLAGHNIHEIGANNLKLHKKKTSAIEPIDCYR